MSTHIPGMTFDPATVEAIRTALNDWSNEPMCTNNAPWDTYPEEYFCPTHGRRHKTWAELFPDTIEQMDAELAEWKAENNIAGPVKTVDETEADAA